MYTKEKARDYYNRRIIDIKCRVCGNIFSGKMKMTTCSSECTKKSKLAGMEIHHHITRCSDCDSVIKDNIKYGKKSKDLIKYKRCTWCSVIHRKKTFFDINTAKREKRANDPMLIPVLTKGGVIYTSIDIMKKISDNMINRNPMKNPASVASMKATIKAKIESGDLKYKKGREHHLYKGNRDNYKYIRSNLQEWRIILFGEANWKCTKCGDPKNIEVHHLEKFTDIILKFTSRPISEYNQTSREFMDLVSAIINYHINNKHIGLVVCEVCHGDIDKQRNPSKKAIDENKKYKN